MPSLDGVADVTFGSQTFSDRVVPYAVPDPPPQITAVDANLDWNTSVIGTAFTLFFRRWPSWVRRGGPGSGFATGFDTQIELATADTWFEEIYVLPNSIDAGIILTILLFQVEVFNAHREGSSTWTVYDDSSAGSGVTLQNPNPPPPNIVMPALTGSVHQLEVSPIGPPQINGFLEFEFLDPESIARFGSIPIIGQRAVIFPFEPEVPIIETLESVTRVIGAANGFEQRSGLREVPRTVLEMKYRTEGDERRRLETLVFDGQARGFGVPVRYEVTELTAAIAIDDITISVVNTDNLTRLVVDGVAMAWGDSSINEALQVASFTSTTITFSSPFTIAFPSGTIIMPVVTAVTVDPVERGRFLNVVQDHQLRFTVVDNGPSLADTSAFNSYQPTGGVTRVLLDDPNLVRGDQISEEFRRRISVVDNRTAFPLVFTSQEVSREATQKGFFSQSAAELANIRGLLHALSGRRVSFYLPTFFPDLEPIVGVASVDQAITIKDINYVNFVQQRQPRNVIRVVGTDGTASDPKLVTGSSKPAPGEETISITPDTIGVTIALADIERVEYIQKARIDTDRVQIQHFDSAGKAVVIFPVVTVLEPDDS